MNRVIIALIVLGALALTAIVMHYAILGKYLDLNRMLRNGRYETAIKYCRQYLVTNPQNKQVKGYLVYAIMMRDYLEELREQQLAGIEFVKIEDYPTGWKEQSPDLVAQTEQVLAEVALPGELKTASEQSIREFLAVQNTKYGLSVQTAKELSDIYYIASRVGAYRVRAHQRTANPERAMYYTMLAAQSRYQIRKADQAIIKLLSIDSGFPPFLANCGPQLREPLQKGIRDKSIIVTGAHIPLYLAACALNDQVDAIAAKFPQLAGITAPNKAWDLLGSLGVSEPQEMSNWPAIWSELNGRKNWHPVPVSIFAAKLLRIQAKDPDFGFTASLATGPQNVSPFILSVDGYDLATRRFVEWDFIFDGIAYKELVIDGASAPFVGSHPRIITEIGASGKNIITLADIVSRETVKEPALDQSDKPIGLANYRNYTLEGTSLRFIQE